MRAVTKGPAMALQRGDSGLSVPKASADRGAVAARAAKPAATAPDAGGGSQRLRANS